MTPPTFAAPLTGQAAIDAAWAGWRAAVSSYERRDPATDPDQYGADDGPDDDWWDDNDGYIYDGGSD